MLENLSKDITFYLLKNKVIECEDSDIYIYGFHVIISTLMVTLSLLVVGMVLNKLLLTLVFMSIFIILRINTGGYHADRFKDCLTFSLTIYLSEILLVKFVPDNLKGIIGIVLLVIGTSIIYTKAPVEHKNNPLSLSEKKKFEKISRTIVLTISTITLLGFYIKDILIDYWFISSLTVMAVAILIIIPLLKGGVTND